MQPVNTASRGSGAGLYGVSAVATGLAALLPISKGGDYSGLVVAGGLYVVGVLLIGVCQLVASMRVTATPHLGGLGAGAGAAAAGFFGVFAAIITLLLPSQYFGPGVYAMWVAAGLGLVSFFVGGGRHQSSDPMGGPAQAIGLISTLMLGIGAVLVPPGIHASLAEWNHLGPGSDSKFALTIQMFIWLPVLGAVVGFSTGKRWGLHCALAALAPLVWIVLSVFANFFHANYGGSFSSAIREKLHPVALVGAIGLVLVIVMGLAGSGATATGSDAGSPAHWAPDPFGRYESRYWDGRRWTDAVSSSGMSLRDSPVAVAVASPLPSHLHPLVGQSPANPGHWDAPVVFAPPEPDHDDRTTSRRSLRRAEQLPLLRFSDGSSATLETPIAIGRNPSPAIGQRRQVVDDSSVSKTHLTVMAEGGRVWIADLHSTNGVDLCEPNAIPVRLQPGERRAVERGATVKFGDSWFTIEKEI